MYHINPRIRTDFELLILAIYYKDKPQVQNLVNNGVELPGGYGSPIKLALEMGDLEIISCLASHGAIIDELDCARCIELGSLEKFKALTLDRHQQELLEQSSQPESGKGCSRLKLSTNMLVIAAKYKQIKMIQYMLEQGIEIDGLYSQGSSNQAPYGDPLNFITRGSTALHLAAIHDSVETIEFLLAKGADLELRDEFGRTPSIAAAACGTLDALKRLIQSGANVRTRDARNSNMLDTAIKFSRPETVRYLLLSGILTETDVTPPPVFLEDAVLAVDLDFADKLIGLGASFRHESFSNTYSLLCGTWPDEGLLTTRRTMLHQLQQQASRTLVEDLPQSNLQRLLRFRIDRSEYQDISNEMTQMASFWLHRCLASHGICMLNELQMPCLPTRVLDVGTQESGKTIVLLETCGMRGQFITLSHRWNAGTWNLRTTSRNIAKYKAGIPMKLLSSSLKTAINVIRQLGIRYAWLDTLCIIQDTEDDKTSEISQMADIYNKSLLTIAIVEPTTESNREDSALHAAPLTQGMRPLGSIDSRAWILQEQILSRRTLSITKTGVYWDCLTHCASSRLPDGIPISHDKGWKQRDVRIFKEALNCGILVSSRALFDLYVHQAWYRIVNEYSTRNLSNEEDKLRAMMGIATRLSLVKKDTFILGLWRKTILADLCWSTQQGRSNQGQRPSTFSAPSWSWLSVTSPVNNTYLGYGNTYFQNLLQACADESIVRTMEYTEDPCSIQLSGCIRIVGVFELYVEGVARWAKNHPVSARRHIKPERSILPMCWLDTSEKPGNNSIVFTCDGMPSALILNLEAGNDLGPSRIHRARRIGLADKKFWGFPRALTIDLI